MGNGVKGFTKFEVGTMYVTVPHQLSLSPYCEVVKAWFALHKSILTSPDHLLILDVFGNGFFDGFI